MVMMTMLLRVVVILALALLLAAPEAPEEESCAPLAVVPVIDFAPFRQGDDPSAKKAVADQIVQAFKTIGFITLVGHGVPETTTASAFAELKGFFSLPNAEKANFKYQSPESNRGWIGMGVEKLADDVPDLKESFDIGDDADPVFHNRWPDGQLPAFRETMSTYFVQYDALHLDVLRAIALGMDLPEEYFTAKCDANHQNLRLLHYPEVERGRIQPDGQKRGGIHTDYGTITLLSQEHISGLRAQRIDGEWISIPPTSGGIAVNIGEMLMRWSNDVLRATPHQVLDDVASDSPTVPERYSIAFFCNANKDTVLDCLPGCCTGQDPSKYEPVNAHEYITGRLAGTISA